MIRLRHILAASAIGAAAMAAVPASAQSTGSIVTAPGAVDELALGPDDEVVVREYVVRRAPTRVIYQENVRLRPGSVVPGYVDLEPMAGMSQDRYGRLAYFVSPDDKIVMVNPETRTVVRIVDR